MNYKRKKPKRQVRCTLCTKTHWLGNCGERWPIQYRRQMQGKAQ